MQGVPCDSGPSKRLRWQFAGLPQVFQALSLIVVCAKSKFKKPFPFFGLDIGWALLREQLLPVGCLYGHYALKLQVFLQVVAVAHTDTDMTDAGSGTDELQGALGV